MTRLLAILALLAFTTLPNVAAAETYNVYLGGMCSTGFQGGKGGGALLDLPGVEVEAFIDQREDHHAAVIEFKNEILDRYCAGNDVCRLLGYSNGGAVISKALSVYGPYNVMYALNSGSNEGGSELATTGWVAEIFGGCDLADEIAPGDHRPAWNHHSTGGATIYTVAGHSGFGAWYDPRRVTSGILPGEDDGATSMASPYYSSSGGYDNGCGSGRWTSHHAAWWCSFDRDHYEIKMQGAKCLANGC
ncbi:MAG: hypothetical protein CMN30_27340 [Sandaracinus sp.]|nr:hypothetical protein [Sandaracinus sp.]